MNKRELTEIVRSEEIRLTKILHDAEKRLQKAPEGSVRIAKHKNGHQFYFRKDSKEKSGIYMPVSQQQKAIALIQKKYDTQIVKECGRQLRAIGRFQKEYNPEALIDIYSNSSETRKVHINPFELPDFEYVKEWSNYDYKKKAFTENDAEHYTSNGERVRSKSEVMIADALKLKSIPYRYECPLTLGTRILHPDFTILKVADRSVLYWEHLGMMDDSVYCKNAIRKIRLYEANGIFPGINLILTMETSEIPINMTIIKRMIEAFCI